MLKYFSHFLAELCVYMCTLVYGLGLTNINGSAYFVYFWSLEDNLTENEWDHASDINNHHYIWNIIWHPILKMFIITVKAKGGTKRDRFFFKLRYFQIIKVNNVISKINLGNNKMETDNGGVISTSTHGHYLVFRLKICGIPLCHKYFLLIDSGMWALMLNALLFTFSFVWQQLWSVCMRWSVFLGN